MRLVKLGLVAVAFLGAVGAVTAYLLYRDIGGVGATAFHPDSEETMEFVVSRGTPPKKIARALQDKGIVEDGEKFFRYMHYVAKKSSALQAGEYVLSPSMTGDDIIEELSSGRVREIKFTVREGLRKEEIADAIAGSGLASKKAMLTAMNDPALARAFGVPETGAGGQKAVPGGIEGYLFPDTYQFPRGTKPAAILNKMRARLDDVITDKMKARMKELDWTLHQVLTLAAIVEKETGQPQERPHISSVFHNRLKKKMKLQTDPTVIYGIKDYDGNIRKRDLLTPHPYNTYTIKGLPPGPIASPGKEAIEAALWPTDDDDLFFVSRNDGTHIFCPTLDCHNAAVQKWQIEFFRNKRKG